MTLKILNPMRKVKQRGELFARLKCGLTKSGDFIYFDCVVKAYLAGYMSAIRETERKK